MYDQPRYWKFWLGERAVQRCRIVARGAKHSVLVEFKDGYRVVTSRYAVRRVQEVV
jgi:hypothetical protein